jgi:hypothetical protein
MPVYEYRCEAGHVTEQHHPAPPPVEVVCCEYPGLRVYSKPMVPLMGWDSIYRRKRRRNAGDTTVSDVAKARRRL